MSVNVLWNFPLNELSAEARQTENNGEWGFEQLTVGSTQKKKVNQSHS